jgi:t-SNARE complex subunit (syntaxin)
MRIRALVVIGLVVTCGPALIGCKKKKVQPFSCVRYQKRMERCENYVLAALKRRFDADVKTGDRDADEAVAQFKMLQWRIRKRIRYKNSQRLCEKLQKLRAPHHRKRYTTMKYCYRRNGCEGFAECMVRLW